MKNRIISLLFVLGQALILLTTLISLAAAGQTAPPSFPTTISATFPQTLPATLVDHTSFPTATGTGFFKQGSQPLYFENSSDVALGDLDNDGDLDAFITFALIPNPGNQVWFNDNQGYFSDSGQRLGIIESFSVVLADVDGDNDLDTVTEGSTTVTLWLNNGSGFFTESSQDFGFLESRDVAFGDVDDDNDADLVLATNEVQLWLNDGYGLFADTGQRLISGDISSVSLGDLDGDIDLDLFVAVRNGHNRIWFNNGMGQFTLSTQQFVPNYTAKVALGDLDNDGDLDAFVGNQSEFTRAQPGNMSDQFPGTQQAFGGANEVWLNDGNGFFTDTGQRLGTEWTIDINLGDLNDDGSLDAFVTNTTPHPSEVWLNNGSGVFSNTTQRLGIVCATGQARTALGDLDNDEDLDAFMPINYNYVANLHVSSVWFNSPVADVTLRQTQTIAGSNITYTLVFTNNGPDSAPAVTIDDLIPSQVANLSVIHTGVAITPTVGITYSWQTQNLLPGEGGIITITGQVSGAGTLINKAIITTDALDPDEFNNEETRLFNDMVVIMTIPDNNSHPVAPITRMVITFSQAISTSTIHSNTVIIHGDKTWLNPTSLHEVSANFAQFQNDIPFEPGENILVSLNQHITSSDGSVVLTPYVLALQAGTGGGSGVFTMGNQVFGTSFSYWIALGDIDNDHDLDIVYENNFGIDIWFNNGSGVFSKSSQVITSGNLRFLGDADGDADLDLFLFSSNLSYTQIWLNDGTGYFTYSGQDLGFSGVPKLADMNGDGHIDLVLYDNIWFSDGQGTFSPGSQPLPFGCNIEFALGDIDNDGDLDAVTVKEQSTCGGYVWLNDSTGYFYPAAQMNQPGLNSDYYRVRLGDVDNDNDLDAVYISHDSVSMGDVEIWLNSGNGIFVVGPQFATSTNAVDFTLADINGDNSLDIIIANYDGPSKIWLNDGLGVFSDSGQNISNPTKPLVMATGDLDEDGDIDIFFGNLGANRIWFNEGAPEPITQLSISDDSPVPPNYPMQLTANAATGTNIHYLWDFGDGSWATGNSVSHPYTATGTYTVIVTASNFVNTVSTTTTVRVIDSAVAGFVAENDSPTALGLDTYLTATVATGVGVTFSWTFGDGTSGNGSNVVHQYTSSGIYTATVTASNFVNIITQTTTVIIVEPIAGLVVSSNSPVIFGEPAILTATITAGNLVSYTWALGDGSTASGASVSHVYPAEGVYTVVMTASNVANVVTATTTVLVNDSVITGLSVTSDSPTPLGVSSHLTATIATGSGVTYLWAFGDGDFGSGANITHTYGTAGVYIAIITASNSVNTVTGTTTVTIIEPISGLTITTDSPTTLGMSTHLTATVVTGSDVTYVWDFGDGALGNGPNPEHTYGSVGVYTVVVTASNFVNPVTGTTAVAILEPISGLIVTNDSPTVLGMNTHLTATVTIGSDVAFSWTFGDGTFGSGPNVIHQYGTSGVYTVVVTASNPVSILTGTTTVHVVTPIAGLNITTNSPVVLGETVMLTATVAVGENISHVWNLGDGSSANGATVSHLYGAPGTYTVVVTATNQVSLMTVMTQVIVTAPTFYIYMPFILRP